MSDTPNQGAENYGKPVYPHVSCSNGPNGDMFMNYMDYVDDNAMFMFSTGQSSRMNALFATGGARVGLLSSLGGVAPGGTTPPPTATYCASKGNSVAYEYIDYVALGSIVRTSGADGGYYNGTALGTSVAAGSSQTLSFSAGFVSTAYSEYVKAYADWNQDGDFIDAGEAIVSAAASTSAATRTADDESTMSGMMLRWCRALPMCGASSRPRPFSGRSWSLKSSKLQLDLAWRSRYRVFMRRSYKKTGPPEGRACFFELIVSS